MRRCPFCAEEIQDEAIKCKHCGEMLSNLIQPKAVASDYRDVKKGIKRVELDKMRYDLKMFGVITCSIVIGLLAKGMGLSGGWSFFIGFLMLCIFGYKAYKTYYEIDNNEK